MLDITCNEAMEVICWPRISGASTCFAYVENRENYYRATEMGEEYH
jgi:hypothetical protein